MRVAVVTDIPSPYQVDLFNAVAGLETLDLTVIYIRRFAKERMWKHPSITHAHSFLRETDKSELRWKIKACDLAIISGYRPIEVGRLINIRARSGMPWAFWGERPGFRFAGWLGRKYRGWMLR